MKIIVSCMVCLCTCYASFSQTNGKQDVFQKTNNAANKISNIIAVFQPYLLKAREIYYDAKQLASNVKTAYKNNLAQNQKGQDTTNNYNNANNNGGVIYSSNDPNNSSQQQTYNQGSYNNNQSAGNTNNYNTQSNSSNGNNIQNYLSGQTLQVNNTATVNNDGTGNWGNQNNGLYGNCLDALTGTVMGMGEAADKPTSVDLMFFAPSDGQNTFYIMTPGFARNNTSAAYMTEHTSEQVKQWSDVNETEVALTKLTLSQFQQIQNNGQIQNAVRNAQNYSGYYASVDQKLDGQVFAIKAQMENREVYALIAIVKQIGNSGSNGYLKIMIKAQGIDNNNGQLNANAYTRQ